MAADGVAGGRTDRANLRASGFKSEPGLHDRHVKEVGGISIYVKIQNGMITSASFALPESGAEPQR
jgi:hypothetical protein